MAPCSVLWLACRAKLHALKRESEMWLADLVNASLSRGLVDHAGGGVQKDVTSQSRSNLLPRTCKPADYHPILVSL